MSKLIIDGERLYKLSGTGRITTRMYVGDTVVDDLFWPFSGRVVETEFIKMENKSENVKVQPNTFERGIFF